GAAVPDAVPGQVGLGERRLEEVLGLGAVAGPLGRGAQQHRSAFRPVRAQLLLPRPVQFTTRPGVAEPPTAGSSRSRPARTLVMVDDLTWNVISGLQKRYIRVNRSRFL